jgi:glycogen operon protein
MQGSGPLGYNVSIPESVNFVTAHDGNTMMDLVSYNLNSDSQTHTHNLSLAWPFGPSDGGNGNNVTSDNGGNQSLRRQKLRNFWTIQYFSKGIPMSLYGDEFGRTQNGNNNTYNVDSVATWNNYAMINTDSPNKVAITGGTYHDNFGTDTKADNKNGLFLFVKELLKVRNNNSSLSNPATTFSNWASADAWATTGSFTIEGGNNGTFCVMVNMGSSEKTFNVPGGASAGWKRIIDTGAWAEPQGNIWNLANAWTVNQATYNVGANTVVIFQK